MKHSRHRMVTRLITNGLFTLILLDTGLAYANAPVINEFVLNHVGTDFNEYVEILGDPNTDLFNVWVLSLEGDSESNRGTIDAAVRFGTTDANGIITTLYQNNRFENGTNTLLLVENFTGAEGGDLDSNNDGVLDSTPWDQILDSVAVSDGGSGDVTYSPVVLAPNFDGGSFTVGGASRLPNGTDTDTPADWVRNDFDAEGIPGFNGSLDLSTETLNTPAALNMRNYASGGGNAPIGLRIHDIQGVTHRSVFEGQAVSDVEGVVTAIDTSPSFAQGFYIQDPAPDTNRRTSEGVFVLTGSTNPTTLASLGDLVQVDGVVEENRPAANVENLTITRIRSNLAPATQTTVVGGGSITPTIIGKAGFLPPKSTISSIHGHIENTAVLNLKDGIDFYESFEGMLLTIPDALAVSATNQFGEVWTVGDQGSKATGISARGGVTISGSAKNPDKRDFNPERIQIDDGIAGGATAGIEVGDSVGDIVGVLTYDFENFELDTLAPLSISLGNLQPETTRLTGAPNALTIATFNVENLDPNDGPRIDELAAIIVNNLKAPDIVALQEVQDNNGPMDDGTVAADQTFDALITAIEAVDSSLLYTFTQIDPLDGQDGGEPGGNIRVGFLFRTDRVGQAPGTPGDAVTNTTVLPGPTLSLNPGRLLDTNQADGDAFASSRKPLVAEFLFNSQSVFVVTAHFNSKGGDQPLFGPSQLPTLVSEAQRRQQAQVVNNFVDAILAQDRRANVVVLGDLNDFPFSEPQNILQGTPDGVGRRVLKNLVNTLPSTEQYTFIFDGNSQALDNILVSKRLANDATVDIVHVDSEFIDRVSDHDPIVARVRPR